MARRASYLLFMVAKPTAFRHAQTKDIFRLLSKLTDKGHQLHRVFDDLLTAAVCALAMGSREAEYLEVAGRYPGQMGVIAESFGSLVMGMEQSGNDLLGDFFEGAITYGEHGQFFTPEDVATMMAQLTDDGTGETVNDPACGSGRCLLAAARINPRRIFYGQDLDHRCAMMTTINLSLWGLKGFVTWGNTLTLETFREYQIGFGVPGRVVWRDIERVAREEKPKSQPKQMVLL